MADSGGAYRIHFCKAVVVSLLQEISKAYRIGYLFGRLGDSRNDVITTFAVLLSTVIYAVSGFDIDGYTGALVSVFIIISGIGLIREILDPLLGQPPGKEACR